LTRQSTSTVTVPRIPERRVGAVLRPELVGRPDLAETPVLDDRDAVGVVRGVQAVGDRDDCSAAEDRRE
jgi:hypothetical protein